MTSTHWQALAPWVHLLWSVLLTVYVWWATRKKARAEMIQGIKDAIEERPTKAELKTLAGDIDGLEDKIERRCRSRKQWIVGLEKTTEGLQKDLEHMPTQKDFQDMRSDMASLRVDLSNTSGRLNGINRAVDLFNEHLINKEGKE